MKNYFSFLLLLTINTFAQSDKLFEVDYKELKMDKNGNGFYALKLTTDFFYEDDRYTVTDTCHGEFGGNIYFKDKQSKVQYALAATCPLIINKLNNKYYLTTSLAHMSGSCGLYEIENPKELTEVDILDYNDYDKKRSILGAKPLIDEGGSLILLSFIYKEKLYHIVSDRNQTYIAERVNTELKIIQSLTNFGMYSYASKVCRTKENHYASIFQTDKHQGFLEVFENNIKVVVYK